MQAEPQRDALADYEEQILRWLEPDETAGQLLRRTYVQPLRTGLPLIDRFTTLRGGQVGGQGGCMLLCRYVCSKPRPSAGTWRSLQGRLHPASCRLILLRRAPCPHTGAGDSVGGGLRAHHRAAASGRLVHPSCALQWHRLRRAGGCVAGGQGAVLASACEGCWAILPCRASCSVCKAPVWSASGMLSVTARVCSRCQVQPTCCSSTWTAKWT